MSDQFGGISTEDVGEAMQAPVWRHLREHGLLPVGPFMRAATEWVTAEQAAIRLAALCPPHALQEAVDEAKRREGALRISPAASMDSVADDLKTGRWQP